MPSCSLRPLELPDLQRALDTCALSENELMLLLAAGPRLANAADPTDALVTTIRADVQQNDSDPVLDETALQALTATIERADPLQRRALAIVALQGTWSDEGDTLPAPGLTADK